MLASSHAAHHLADNQMPRSLRLSTPTGLAGAGRALTAVDNGHL